MPGRNFVGISRSHIAAAREARGSDVFEDEWRACVDLTDVVLAAETLDLDAHDEQIRAETRRQVLLDLLERLGGDSITLHHSGAPVEPHDIVLHVAAEEIRTHEGVAIKLAHFMAVAAAARVVTGTSWLLRRGQELCASEPLDALDEALQQLDEVLR